MLCACANKPYKFNDGRNNGPAFTVRRSEIRKCDESFLDVHTPLLLLSLTRGERCFAYAGTDGGFARALPHSSIVLLPRNSIFSISSSSSTLRFTHTHSPGHHSSTGFELLSECVDSAPLSHSIAAANVFLFLFLFLFFSSNSFHTFFPAPLRVKCRFHSLFICRVSK